ncbi:MAG: hypothetical protein ACE5G1_04590 [bacterium]
MAELKKREKILSVVAGSALLIFALNQFVCNDSEDENKKAEKTSAVASPGPGKPAVLDSPTPEKSPRRRQSSRQIKFVSWGRDPFSEAYRLAEADSAGRDSSNFVLRGIIWKGREAHALIGNLILKEGERHGDLKVLDIQKDRVICRKGRRVLTLALRKYEN